MSRQAPPATFDDAITKFNEALKTNPQCSDCYYNIGVANAGKKDYDKAEEAYKKAIEVKPSADATTASRACIPTNGN